MSELLSKEKPTGAFEFTKGVEICAEIDRDTVKILMLTKR